MQAQRWQVVEELFAELTTIPPQERATRLNVACGNDAELRSELLSLLEAHDSTAGPLDSAPSLASIAIESSDAVSELARPGLAPGMRVGPYRLSRLIGEGGMGSVWLAERVDGVLKRTVALKLPHVAWLGGLSERLARERDILAQLEHPNIARLYDAGIVGDGRPYLALECITGVPITDYCDREQLSISRRLELFLQALDAVRYAHAHLVIHRDIKPSNILVSADGRVHLLDFGIAKLLTGEPNDARTEWDARALTPDYASPEQISGGIVSTASDIYSLGVLLHEMLSGARPYVLKRDSRGALEDAILETDPHAPSRTIQESAAHARATTPRILARVLRGDLDNIVLKTLQKRPQDRYASVDLFAQDIQRYLRGEPILAKAGTPWYYAGKFLQRHKIGVASASAVILALVGGLAAALWQADRAEQQTHRAEIEARTSRAVEKFIEEIFLSNSRESPDPIKARTTTARELLQKGVKKIDAALDDAPEAKLRILKTLANLQFEMALDEEAVSLYRKQVALAKRVYGPNDRRVAEALVALSPALMTSQETGEREAVLNEALGILDRQKDSTSQLRGILYGEFSQWAFAYDLQRSLKYAQESVRLLRRYPPSKDLAEALVMEAVIRTQLGAYSKAEGLLTEAAAVATATQGARSAKLPRIYAYRAEARFFLGAWPGAEQDLRAGCALAREIGGDEDMQAVQLQQRLALFLLRTSRPKEARDEITQARAVMQKISSQADAWYLPMMLESAGLILGEVGDLEQAMAALEQANANWRKYHAGTSDVISAAERYASLLIAAGRLDEARVLMDEAAAIRQKLKDHQTNLNGDVMVRVAWLLASRRPRDALPVLQGFKVTEAQSKFVSTTHLQHALQIAKVQLALQDYAAAIHATESIRREVEVSPLRRYLQSYEAEALAIQGKALLAGGKAHAALPLLDRSHSLYSELLDTQLSLIVADAKVALAECRMALGQIAVARQLAKEAAAIHARHGQIGDQYRIPLQELRQRTHGAQQST